MKIVHVCLNRNGGAANAAWRLHENLLEQGIDSWFFTLEPRAKEDPSMNWLCWKPLKPTLLDKAYLWLQRRVTKLLLFKRYQALKSFREKLNHTQPGIQAEIFSLPESGKEILQQPIFRDADIIHLHWVTLLLNWTDFFRQCNRRYRLVWTFHDLNPLLGIFNYEYDVKQNQALKSLEDLVREFKRTCIGDYAQKIFAVAPSAWISNKIQSSGLADKFDVVEIPYNYEMQLDVLKQSKPRMRLLSVAENNSSGRKNTGILSCVAKHFPGIELIVTGRCEALDNTGMDNLHYTGFLDKSLLQQAYADSDAVIITSLEDNLPNVMLEAFLAGRPVICFPVGGMRQYVIEGLTGVQARDLSDDAMLKAITTFIESRDNYDAKLICQFAAKHFSNKQVIGAYQLVYNKAMA